ncbi:hypothetical protein TRAPUB_5282 [Trametes pubescens]|uniref:Uncharacterized protein n=1 Tax=Trametes pubescens TaxID=154538 RepID=A0A1M2V915_TRAPU|nr:hypothetical protein TRAPUB_5282 [Trametes pubescens]
MGQQFWFDFIALETSSTTTSATTTGPILHPGTPTLPTSTPPITSSTNLPQTTSSVRPPTSTSTGTFTSVSSTLTSYSVTIETSSLVTSFGLPSPLGTISNRLTTISASTSTPARPYWTPTSSPNPSNTAAISSPSSLSTSSSAPATPTAGASPAGGHTLSPGEIIGIATGGAALILVLALMFFALWQRHRRIAARAAICPFVPGPEDDVDGMPLPPPDYWTSEKGSIVGRVRLSIPMSVPARQMLVIAQRDHLGGVWADYQSSMPSASGYDESESSAGGDLKMLREHLARRGWRSAAVCVAGKKRGTPF